MKVENVKIKNFKGIPSLEVAVEGKNVFAIGRNGVGKTSFLDAIWYALTGDNLPTEPTTGGAKNGTVEVDLGQYVAKVKFSNSKPSTFELIAKETGEAMAAPRSYLNERIGIINFDINKFFEKSGLEQVNYLSKLMKVDLSSVEGEIEEATEQRKLIKRDVTRLKSLVGFYDATLADKEVVDIAVLSNQISTEQAKVSDRRQVEGGISNAKGQIESLRAQLQVLEGKVANAEQWLKLPENASMSDEDFETLRKTLTDASVTNKLIEEAKTMKKHEAELEAAEMNVEALTNSIEDLRRDKSKQLKEALNVQGLEYDVAGEQFLFEGLPFAKNQINTAAQIIAGLRIGASLLKDLKILRLDGSLIDDINMSEIKSFAAAEGIELFIELVDRSAAGLTIHVED
jgi:DNA repair exonuclease SbcCD ATPase subunit